MADVTAGLVGYGVSKVLDRVLDYVGKALKVFEYCEELQTLLRGILPWVKLAEAQRSSTASGEAVKKWLKDLGELLEEAEQALHQALAVAKKSVNLVKRKKLSDEIRELTERIRKTGRDGCPFAILSVVTDIKSDTAAIKIDATAIKIDATAIKSDTTAIKSDTTAIMSLLDILRIQQCPLQQGKAAPQHPLVHKLKELGRRTRRNQRCPVALKVADTHTREFHVPGHGDGIRQGVLGDALRQRRVVKGGLWELHGRVVKGGIDVNNATKLQLTMKPKFEGDWFFYILFLDHLERAPSLYFPEEAGHDHTLVRPERVFPNNDDYDDDPETMKLERSSNAPSDACERVTLYLVVVDTRVEPEDPSGNITLEDVEKHLQSPALKAIVNDWIFDIRPPQV